MSLPAGARLGPYEVLDLVGAGGMGEVYRARDPRLGRDVAIKVLPAEVGADPGRLRRFEQEARAVAALNHPNILTVFDVGTHVAADTPIPYVVTELLQGETLREMVSRRTPTQRQVLSFAVQVAQGLDAAHGKGIVHRDLKPENVFVTTDGRVKLLDFGLAKQLDRLAATSGEATESRPTAAGQVVGTVGYMSPEQVRGLPVDARTDVFSFGVLLYELLSGKHPFRRETTIATLTAILEETPAELASLGRGIPPTLSGIVRTCLEKSREERFHSTHDLARSLEAVLAAPAGAASLEEVEERGPYPGLSSFTERDAASFFGREAEIRALWQRLQNRRLLAVIGPSGTGKTSFVRAGVIAAAPEGWRCLWVSPGNRPFPALVRSLVPELSGDPETLQRLVGAETNDERVAAIGRWRRQHGEVLLVVDQFEELFTLNPGEVQEDYATLLGRLASEADVHVLASLRDDFLMRSQEQAPLRPILGELTALLPLSAEALRRAVVEPAKKRGYAFEDEALVEEMVESVEGARGALPLLAFAVARLWEKRDRERKLLTRAAYEAVGGVAGALAQHAEATMDRIGPERQGFVREVFRNLMTAQGTRAVAEREELLSVCPERQAAEEVLRELIDARLVTSYEVEGKEGEPSRHRIEVVHESLLKAWPRLVRWQAQDEEGAVLRDQLKQAAHLWEEKGRTSDLLWTGTAFQECVLWRGRYPGALTALEENFARAMAEKARRRKRLLTATVASVIVALAGIAIAIGLSRRQATRARDEAKAEALRAEAGKLLALARTEIDRYPTAALAYARKSLELADTPEARRLAVEVLWRGPVARILPAVKIAKELGGPESSDYVADLALSPDGNWLATASADNRQVLLFPRDGGAPRALPRPSDGNARVLEFGPQSDRLVTGGLGESLRFWSLPDLQQIRAAELGGVRSAGAVRGGKLLTFTQMSHQDREPLVRAWSFADGEPELLGKLDLEAAPCSDIDPTRTWLVFGHGRSVRLRALDASRRAPQRILGNLRDACLGLAVFPTGDRLASFDRSGEIRLWSLTGNAPAPLRILQGPTLAGEPRSVVPSEMPMLFFSVDRQGSHLAETATDSSSVLWDLSDPPEAEPVLLRQPDPAQFALGDFDPGGQWLVRGNGYTIGFWSLSTPWARVLRGRGSSTFWMSFTTDGRWLASCAIGEPARLWPLNAADGAVRTLIPEEPCWSIAAHPKGTHVLVGTTTGKAILWPTEGGPPRRLLEAWEGGTGTWPVAFDAEGRRAVAAAASPMGLKDPRQRALRVWDLASGEARVFSIAHLTDASWFGFWTIRFAPDGSLLAGGPGGVRRLVLPVEPNVNVSSEIVYPTAWARFDLTPDGRQLLALGSRTGGGARFDKLVLLNLAERTSRPITSHGDRLFAGAFDASGRIVVTGDIDGVVRAGPATGEEPHLLLGHTGQVTAVAVSSDGRWIASATDQDIRLWPMPDVSKPPLHTLPHAELMARLDALTNLRVVREPTSATGWKLDLGPFPGWKDVPAW